MEFPKEVRINLAQEGIQGIGPRNVKIYSGITTFVGPNGSGKTQLMRGLKRAVTQLIPGKKVRYVSAGRLGPIESYRSDFDGQRGGPNYDRATYGNQSSMARRHLTETVLGDFASLSERTDILIKVQERLRKLFDRNLRIDWDAGNLRAFFERVDVTANEYSSAREASGLLHLVATLAALYDDEVSCILIDEPEVSLHPQLQSYLYQEMSKIAGDPDIDGRKLIFLSTHSTEFIHLQSVDDLASIVFCSDMYEAPVQIDPDIDEFRSRQMTALLSRIGQEYKLALFCKRPLLVEGSSDHIMCSGINNALELNTEAAGSQILPVTGKGQITIVIKLMRLLGKKPVVLADTDGLADGLDLAGSFTSLAEANTAAVSMGHRNASDLARTIYNDFANLVKDNWDDIRDLAVQHAYWINRGDCDEFLTKKRAAFSTLLNADSRMILELNNSKQWMQTACRLRTLLEFLNSLGCFILTKGTIEDYYIHEIDINRDDKRNAAAHEASHFADTDKVDIRRTYADIVAAIEFAAQAEMINEGMGIRDLVLAVVTPALASISGSTTTIQLKAQSKGMLGKRSDLFDLKVETGGGLHLVVSLNTSILDVEGFPLRIPVDANPITSVNEQMNLE